MFQSLIKLIVLVCFVAAPQAAISAPKPFASDGCTGFWDGTPKHPLLWQHCCIAHDLFFWAGGVESARDAADFQLRQCVEETGSPLIAALMYFMVRTGSHSPWKINGMQWGNAWSDELIYRPLSQAEIESITAEMELIDLPTELKQSLIESLWSKSYSGD
jgi:hypothetical protein